MNLVDGILGCFVWLPIVAIVLFLVNWMIAGDIDVISGILGIGACMGLGFLAWKPPAPYFTPLALLILVATCVLFPFIRSGLTVKEIRSLDVDQLERAYQQFAFQPKNPGAKFKIARFAYALGMRGHAYAIAEELIPSMPAQIYSDEHRMFRQWQEERSPNWFVKLACKDCRHLNDPGRIHCERCGAPFLLDQVKSPVTTRGNGRQLLAVWIAVVGVSLALPLIGTLDPMIAIPIILLVVAAVLLVLYLAFRDKNDDRGLAT